MLANLLDRSGKLSNPIHIEIAQVLESEKFPHYDPESLVQNKSKIIKEIMEKLFNPAVFNKLLKIQDGIETLIEGFTPAELSYFTALASVVPKKNPEDYSHIQATYFMTIACRPDLVNKLSPAALILFLSRLYQLQTVRKYDQQIALVSSPIKEASRNTIIVNLICEQRYRGSDSTDHYGCHWLFTMTTPGMMHLLLTFPLKIIDFLKEPNEDSLEKTMQQKAVAFVYVIHNLSSGSVLSPLCTGYFEKFNLEPAFRNYDNLLGQLEQWRKPEHLSAAAPVELKDPLSDSSEHSPTVLYQYPAALPVNHAGSINDVANTNNVLLARNPADRAALVLEQGLGERGKEGKCTIL